MKKKLTMTFLALAAFGTVASIGTLAIYTDQAQIPNNQFATGSIDISTTPSTAAFNVSLLPGESITDDIVVTNGATSSQFRYAVTGAATDPDADGFVLKDQLVLVIKTIDATTPVSPCSDFDGTQLYTGDLDGTAGVIIGSTAQGAQAGDRVLAGNTSETLCFRVTLPSSTPNDFDNHTTVATYTFDAEQTSNNP